MPYNEVMLWYAYAKKHGGLPVSRQNFLLASLATMTNNAHGGKATLQDFLPALPAPEPNVINDAEEFMKALYGQ